MNIQHLKSRLHYNPETGVFTWLGNNKEAGHVRDDGYRVIRYCNQLFLAHRLAYFYIMEHWPQDQIDHKDRDKGNNKWDNLRDATSSQNNMNRDAKGYYERVRKGRPGIWYSAHIEKDGKKYASTFRSEAAAKKWREDKEQELFGEFSREAV